MYTRTREQSLLEVLFEHFKQDVMQHFFVSQVTVELAYTSRILRFKTNQLYTFKFRIQSEPASIVYREPACRACMVGGWIGAVQARTQTLRKGGSN